MRKAVLAVALLVCLATPVSALAVVLVDQMPADTAGSARPSGASLGGSSGAIHAAASFTVPFDTEMNRVTFQAYQRVGSSWDNLLDFRITLPDTTTGLPVVAPIAGGAGTDVPVRETARDDNSGSFYVFGTPNESHELVTYTFDLAGVGVDLTSGTPYWLVLNAGDTTPSVAGGATNLLWAFNSLASGATVSNTGAAPWLPVGILPGSTAFRLEYVPVPSTLALIGAGFLVAGALGQRRRDVGRSRL